MSKHTLSDLSTIYHYTLLYRFTKKHPFFWLYSIMLILWAGVSAVHYGLKGVQAWGGSILLVILLQACIAVLLRRFSQSIVPREWAWGFVYPFFGYMPAGHITASGWARANRHRFFIGYALILPTIIWLPMEWVANLAAAQYLLLLPQLVYIRKCVSLNRGGLVKINKNDISYYKN